MIPDILLFFGVWCSMLLWLISILFDICEFFDWFDIKEDDEK